jgi:predicted lipoprotein with Yx(FWY)xxD motif
MRSRWIVASGVLLSMTVAACGSSGTSKVTNAPVPSANSGALVSVANNAHDGPLLVGANGHTLYLFEKDTGTTSACTGGCAATWPALVGTGTPTGSAGVDASKLSSATGQVPNQVVYNGHLLYYFAADSAPGDLNGVKIADWYPVSPAGSKIDKS